ncbi:cadherin domain-containing protein [Opitutales bacterium]|nr:cadherin domain-containing protein [Opitutales bacterium]
MKLKGNTRIKLSQAGWFVLSCVLLPLSSFGALFPVTQSSLPAGLVSQSAIIEEGENYTSINPQLDKNGYTFGYWKINGTRQAGADGRSLTQVSTIVQGDSNFTAHYYADNEDTDGDGVMDWFEYRMFGDLSKNPSDDSDGDGFSNKRESELGQDALIVDFMEPGGIAGRMSNTFTYADTSMSVVTIKSNPSGFITTSITNKELNASVSTQSLNGATNGSHFAYWTVNGVRQASPNGVASSKVTLNISGVTQIIAHYIPSTEDTDGDGVMDWFELYQFGNLASGPSDDSDGDGFSNKREGELGQEATIAEFVEAGGIAGRMSNTFSYADTSMVLATITSDPKGFITESVTYKESNSTVTTQNLNGATNGSHFAYWTINGVRQFGPTGVSQSKVSATITADTIFTAHYIPSTEDTDTDGVMDWFEMYQFGNLTQGPNDDPDGDGYSNKREGELGQEATIAEFVENGGIAGRMSNSVTYYLQVNNPPNALNLSSTNVHANKPTGELVGIFQPSDPDDSDNNQSYVISFLDGNGSTDRNKFSISGMNLLTTSSLSVGNYLINVRVSDDENASLDKNFTIQAIHDPNKDDDNDTLTYAQEQALGTSDQNPDSDGDGFSDKAEITHGSNPADANSIINFSPHDLNASAPLTFIEKLPINTIVAEFNATDPDGDALTYSLTTGVGDGNNSLFTMENNGSLRTAQIFNYETNASTYSIRVQSRDEYNNSVEGNFTIQVLQKRDIEVLNFSFASSEEGEIKIEFGVELSEEFNATQSVNLLYWLKNSEQKWIILDKNESRKFLFSGNLGKYISNGTFEIRKITFDNKFGSLMEYDTGILNGYGLITEKELNNPNSDSTPPIVTSFNMSNFTFDHDTERWQSDYELNASDDVSGLRTNWILELENPSGNSLQQHNYFNQNNSSGSFYLPKFAASGNYKIENLRIYDNASNSGWVTNQNLISQGWTSQVNLQNPDSDDSPPQIENLELFSGYNPKTDKFVVVLKFKTSDQQSGYKKAYIRLIDSAGNSIDHWIPKSKGMHQLFYINLTDAYSVSSVTINFLNLFDHVENKKNYTSEDLENLGFSASTLIDQSKQKMVLPFFTYTNELTIEENEPAQTVVDQFSSLFNEDTPLRTYSFVDNNTTKDNQYFTLSPSGTLTTLTTFNYETNASTYLIGVQARDEYNNTVEGNFTILLQDVIEDLDQDGIEDHLDLDIDGDGFLNTEEVDYGSDPRNANSIANAPPANFKTTTPLTILENMPVGTIITEFNASDPDPNSSFSYSLVLSHASNSNLFNVDLNGTLRTATVFDFETNASNYSIQVQVKDEHNASIEKSFVVNLLNINDEKPSFVGVDWGGVQTNAGSDGLLGTEDDLKRIELQIVENKKQVDLVHFHQVNDHPFMDQEGMISWNKLKAYTHTLQHKFAINTTGEDIYGHENNWDIFQANAFSHTSYSIGSFSKIPDLNTTIGFSHTGQIYSNGYSTISSYSISYSGTKEIEFDGRDIKVEVFDLQASVNAPHFDSSVIENLTAQVQINQDYGVIGWTLTHTTGLNNPSGFQDPFYQSGPGGSYILDYSKESTLLELGGLRALDPDGDVLVWSLGNSLDQDLFILDANTGKLAFSNAPDFEQPKDNNKDNQYEVILKASDGTFHNQIAIEITVINDSIDDHDQADPINSSQINLPIVQTFAAEYGGNGTFHFTGQVLTNGGSSVFETGIILSTKISLDDPIRIASQPDQNSSVFHVSYADLLPGKTYYLRAYAVNQAGENQGSLKKFKTAQKIDPDSWYSKAEALPGGWKMSDWLGAFRPTEHQWIYHAEMGWLYPSPMEDGSLWLWNQTDGWRWTQQGVYPYLFRWKDSAWVYLHGQINGRILYYNYSTQSYE